jgi:hypothetical protein
MGAVTLASTSSPTTDGHDQLRIDAGAKLELALDVGDDLIGQDHAVGRHGTSQDWPATTAIL